MRTTIKATVDVDVDRGSERKYGFALNGRAIGEGGRGVNRRNNRCKNFLNNFFLAGNNVVCAKD